MELTKTIPVGMSLSSFKEQSEGFTFIEKLIALVQDGASGVFYFSSGLTAQEISDLDSQIAAYVEELPYRVIDLANDEFKNRPIENIDFARHLKKDIALNKFVTMTASGRPDKAEYDLDGVKIARISFEFETNESNLLTRRREWLFYYRTDDSLSDPILIKDKKFNLATLEDGSLAMEERVTARGLIVQGCKAFLGGLLQTALSQTMEEVTDVIKPFWDECESDREAFIDLATHDWKDWLSAIDLQSTPHTWLAIDIGGGVTVRDYIVSKLSY